jgi:hypothetical protein
VDAVRTCGRAILWTSGRGDGRHGGQAGPGQAAELPDPLPDELLLDDPLPDELLLDEPLPDDPLPDELLLDEPLPDDPLPDEPLPDEPLPDEPLPDEPLPDEPWPDEPLPDPESLLAAAEPLEPLEPLELPSLLPDSPLDSPAGTVADVPRESVR